MFKFAEKCKFLKKLRLKNDRDRPLIRLHIFPAIMISASAVSNTRFSSANSLGLCDILSLVLQAKQGKNKSIKVPKNFLL